MPYTRRSIRKQLLELNRWDKAQVESKTSGAIIVTDPTDGTSPDSLYELIAEQVRAMGYAPILLELGDSNGRSWVRFCTQETVDERSQGGMLSEPDLRTFERAGGVLRETTTMSELTGGNSDILGAFEEFRQDPGERFRVRLLRTRAAQIQDLLSDPSAVDLETFDRQVQSRGAGTLLRGSPVDQSLLDGELPPDRAAELEAALDRGELILSGNYLFDLWSARFAVMDGSLDDARRTEMIRRMLEIFHTPEISPLERVEQVLAELRSVGRTGATAIGALLFPTEVPVSQERVRKLLRSLGHRFSGVRNYADIVRQIREEVGAEDFLELHRFFDWYLRRMARTSTISPREIIKVAPGPQGKYWEECLQGGFICAGWPELGDLEQYKSQEAIREACLEKGSTNRAGVATMFAEGLWTLVNLQPGDIVVANRGLSHILGIGEVVAPGYEYRPDRPYYPQVVTVAWDTSVVGDLPSQGPRWMNTIVRLSEAELDRIRDQIGGEIEGAFAALMERLIASGLYFSPELVSNYLLALQAKRFAILTGISGTGKTQLARAVARHFQPVVETQRSTEVPEEAVEVDVKPYMLDYNRTILPVALLAHLDLPSADVSGGVFLQVQYAGGNVPLRVSTGGQGNAKELLFKGEFKKWFAETFRVGDRFLLRPCTNDDSTPADLEILVPSTVAQRETLPNYRIIAVRPDWTDNRGLLGYYNPITESYVTTDFLRLLLDAHAEVARAAEAGREPFPFFAILDEMNLARVEHYFSDFLSALESEEEIELHHNEAVEIGEVGDGVAVPRRLKVPRNVFFTGTVNVDETTYMFSPKVLDRAFTIEFNEVDLSGFGSPPIAGDGGPGLHLTRLPESLGQVGKPSTSDWNAFGDLVEGGLRSVVVELNDLLEGATRHFGYRVANEIGRFVVLAAEQSDGSIESVWSALDLAVLQKVLPKFHGTQQELEGTLQDLLVFAVLGSNDWTSEEHAAAHAGWRLRRGSLVREGTEGGDPPRLPRTAAKVWRMLERVRKQGFTAYVE